jgi:putative phage resistance protein
VTAGTLTWLTTSWHTLNALRHGTLLLVDELDASLHPGLARYLVQLFLDSQTNPLGAQLIFTTHDVSLLGNSPTRLLEPRQVWFTEKDRSGRSELFCLDDFDNPGLGAVVSGHLSLAACYLVEVYQQDIIQW